jgi:hypothetical protein
MSPSSKYAPVINREASYWLTLACAPLSPASSEASMRLPKSSRSVVITVSTNCHLCVPLAIVRLSVRYPFSTRGRLRGVIW